MRLTSTVYDTAKRKKSINEAQFIETNPTFNASDPEASDFNKNTTNHVVLCPKVKVNSIYK